MPGDKWEEQLKQSIKMQKEKERREAEEKRQRIKEAEHIHRLCKKQEKKLFEESVLPICKRFAKATGWFYPIIEEDGRGDSFIQLFAKSKGWGIMRQPDRGSASIFISVYITDPLVKKGDVLIQGEALVDYEDEYPIIRDLKEGPERLTMEEVEMFTSIYKTEHTVKRCIVYRGRIPIDDFTQERLKASLQHCFSKVSAPRLLVKRSRSGKHTLVDPTAGLKTKIDYDPTVGIVSIHFPRGSAFL